MGLSALVHLGLGLFLWSNRPLASLMPEAEPILVELFAPPRVAPPPPPEPTEVAPGGSAEAAPVEVQTPAPAPVSQTARPTLAPPTPVRPRPARLTPPAYVEPIPAAASAPAAPAPFPTVSDAALAGALHAGTGAGAGGSGRGPGGGRGDGSGPDCDMVRRLQDALADDAQVAEAVARAGADSQGRALLVWNGAWVQASGQAGRGLAGVRQALAVEIAFAPAACRGQTLAGLAVIRLNNGARLALGDAAWRWTDLLEARR